MTSPTTDLENGARTKTVGAFCWVIQTERNASHQQNALKILTVLS
jgi:hypothetical protein